MVSPCGGSNHGGACNKLNLVLGGGTSRLKMHFLDVLSLGRTRGGPPPMMFFLNFSKMNNHLDLPFSVAVRTSLKHILTQVW